jgi:hypothetical protein
MIIGVGCVVIKMTKLFVEVAILIVAYFDYPVFHTKRIAKVYTNIVVMNFNGPIIHVFAVEQRNPSVGFILF